ncbi:hypothetical protein [Streptomyces griseiscabiei]|uniref:Secreted protein n=1 Tax=Streptomyces griseiscabiei TaxID=2993540 RepID=A0ABU4LJE9_9ACTN|nr:hypothetical protein [Streptomyces griseiscabiei]MBZ3900567.1 hypothetical protein [Streptomyces griseiscabiei]MDX2915906.1 hypothetical protein [Streptomyces griseiscabiei]
MAPEVRIFSIAVAVIFLAGGGFAAGRLTAPEAPASTVDCSEPRKLSEEFINNSSKNQEAEQQRYEGRMAANAILQTPDCFSSTDRAAAQTLLDTIEQGVQQDAIDGLRSDTEECVEDATDAYSWSDC